MVASHIYIYIYYFQHIENNLRLFGFVWYFGTSHDLRARQFAEKKL